jgi:hypothetical protein
MYKEHKKRKEITGVWFIIALFLLVGIMIIPDMRRAVGEVVITGNGLESIQTPVTNGNYALQFDGVGDYVEIPEIAAIRTKEKEPLTVEFWVFVA